MRGASKTPPKYRLHKRSGQAIVTLSGQDHYLGQHGTAESKSEYDRLICQWLANGRKPIDLSEPEPEIAVVDVCAAYWRHCKGYYVKDGKPTEEQAGIKAAIRRLKEEFGRLPVSELGPLKIQALQQRFVRDGVSRYYVNKSINRLKRMFRWAVSQELIPPSISQAIDSVTALKKGRTDAYELKPVPPVDDETVEKTLPRVASPITRDMIRIQRLTGMRPGELFVMKPKDIDRNGPEGCWLYHPERHKTEHHDQKRVVVIGPKAQALLAKYLLKADDEHCFLTERGKPYNRSNYRDRIRHACQMAFPAPDELSDAEKKVWEKEHRWRPNQLRHSLATEVRKQHGLETVARKEVEPTPSTLLMRRTQLNNKLKDRIYDRKNQNNLRRSTAMNVMIFASKPTFSLSTSVQSPRWTTSSLPHPKANIWNTLSTSLALLVRLKL